MKKKALKKGMRNFLHILQHILIVAAAVAILFVITGSTVMMKGVDGNYSYSMDMKERGKDYEESLIFNHILGRGVADVARMGAVRSQMETDGAFDGNKEVDIATFYYRYGGLPDQYITARYRLEDLIKWAQYGFEYEERWMSGEEAGSFLNTTTTYTRIDNNSGQLQGGIVTPFNSDVTEYTSSYGVSANGLENVDFVRDDTTAKILDNRYQTVDGKNIEDYTGSWEDYYELCSYVESVANNLNSNYESYMKYEKYYSESNSNLRYYIKKTIGDREEIYSNLSAKELSGSNLTNTFKNYGKYIYFYPVNMEYATDSLITETTVRQIFNGYEYAYPETTQVWIGVDTSYPVNDVYIQGLNGYKSYVPYYWQLVGSIAVILVLYMILFIFLTVKEGRETDEEGNTVIRLKYADHLPTEITVLGTIILLGGIFILLTYVFDSMSFEYYYTSWFKLAAGLVVLLCELLFTGAWYSIVRRLKADNLWAESVTCKLLKKGKTGIWKMYDNGSSIVKTWLPYVIFLLVNLALIALLGRKGVLIAFVLDMAFGVLIYRNTRDRQRIVKGIEKIRDGDLKYKVDETSLHGDNLTLAQAVNSIGDGIRSAVETSMKDERLKADLITNVSHDIKTPLTSIINYVALIKRENMQDGKISGYVDVLDAKSQRLKQLTDDLVEASKISSGNLSLNLERINMVELVNQTLGEFSEKFEEKQLTPVFNTSYGKMYIEADSRRIWRVVENLFNNIFKYALEGTRVYMDMLEKMDAEGNKTVEFALKNISAQPLNINAGELTERFIRGDVARSTEGSGLGLSIAKSLTEAQNGKFEILLDGDLFKVILTFPLLDEIPQLGTEA